MNMKLDEAFISLVRGIILESKNAAIRSVDFQRVLMYWQIGEKIVLEDQQGKSRAGYGDKLIQTLAKALEPEFGSGFSHRQMERSRQFYRIFPISSALRTEFSWTHYHSSRKNIVAFRQQLPPLSIIYNKCNYCQ